MIYSQFKKLSYIKCAGDSEFKNKTKMETAIEKRQRIISLYIVHISMFIFSLGNSVILMGVWPYLQAVRKFHYILAFRKTLIKPPYLINNSTLEKYTII